MKRFVGTAILAGALAFAGVAKAQNIPIAVVGPLTGSNAALGEQMKRGAEMAELNGEQRRAGLGAGRGEERRDRRRWQVVE